MPYIYSSSVSQLSTSTLNHQWDPYQVLDLRHDQRCVGWAPSKGRKCLHIINGLDKDIFHDIASDISSRPLDAIELRPKLYELARHGLCLQVPHRGSQVGSMVEKWTKKIDTAVQLAREQATMPQQHIYTRSTTESLASTQSGSAPIRRITRAPTSTVSSSTLSANAVSEAESLRRSIAAMQATIDTALRRLERIDSPHAPRIAPIQPLDRVHTSDISSARLSTPSSRTLSTASTRSSSARSSTRSPSPTRSTSSRFSATSTSSSDSPPPAGPAQPLHRPQTTSTSAVNPFNRTQSLPSPAPSTPSTPEALRRSLNTTSTLPMASQFSEVSSTPPAQTTTDTPPTPARHTTSNPPLDYSSPPLTPHLITPPSTAPPSPRSSTPCPRTHVRRIPLTPSSECPICYDPLGPESAQIEWCRSGCGQSMHVECMASWRAISADDRRGVRCVMCRTAWEECEC